MGKEFSLGKIMMNAKLSGVMPESVICVLDEKDLLKPGTGKKK